jgi:hypothetical protein
MTDSQSTTSMSGMRALILLGIVLGLTGCTYPSTSIPTGVAAPGHNWLEGGD